MSVSEAVSRLFLRHQPMLMDYIQGLVRNTHDSDDVFQEVGVVILQKTDAPSGDREFAAWCRAIARNHVLHYWRSLQRSRTVAGERLLAVVDEAYREADEDLEDWGSRRRALAGCMEEVPAVSRQVLALHYVDGLKSGEIARRLGRTATAVRMAISRLRRQLLACVERRLAPETEP